MPDIEHVRDSELMRDQTLRVLAPVTKRMGVPFEARITFDRTGYQRAKRDFDGTRAEPVRGIMSPTVAPDAGAMPSSR